MNQVDENIKFLGNSQFKILGSYQTNGITALTQGKTVIQQIKEGKEFNIPLYEETRNTLKPRPAFIPIKTVPNENEIDYISRGLQHIREYERGYGIDPYRVRNMEGPVRVHKESTAAEAKAKMSRWERIKAKFQRTKVNNGHASAPLLQVNRPKINPQSETAATHSVPYHLRTSMSSEGKYLILGSLATLIAGGIAAGVATAAHKKHHKSD